ncbi:amidase [Streptomyces sp. NPDC006879]|uniref:amidase n=1 Tax=Streptomyces sp. NPDC006879 TaxID=3364767 RepID=UPI0036A5406C
MRAGEVSPTELTEHYLERIERLDGRVGAYVTVTAELAREQAERAEAAALAARRDQGRGVGLGPLHGVPVPIKDLHQVAGVRCTFGSQAFADHVPAIDDHIAVRMRAAGTVLLGKTNTPEFGLPCYTENQLAPPARTPWDLERSAGGSSGGAAAAVSAGLAPLAHGSDGGGSIRIPASVCGLLGIKPSRGRVSAGPVLHDVSGLSTSGPLARTVADAAALLDVLAGPMSGDPYGAPSLPPGDSFLAAAGREPGAPLRVVALATAPVAGVQVHPECLAAHAAAIGLLRDLGHHVEEMALPADGRIRQAFEQVWSVMAVARPVPERDEKLLMPLTRHLRERGRRVSGTDFSEGLYVFRAFGQLIADSLLSTYDVILTPTLAQLPAPVGSLRVDADPAAEFDALAAFTPFTPLYNATGQPAVSVPLHWTDEGLPIGVMFGGRYGEDSLLISLAAQLEAARPWAHRRPALW